MVALVCCHCHCPSLLCFASLVVSLRHSSPPRQAPAVSAISRWTCLLLLDCTPGVKQHHGLPACLGCRQQITTLHNKATRKRRCADGLGSPWAAQSCSHASRTGDLPSQQSVSEPKARVLFAQGPGARLPLPGATSRIMTTTAAPRFRFSPSAPQCPFGKASWTWPFAGCCPHSLARSLTR
ncbi:hypothetical protein DM02DRAFT_633553 [Periconia macrospinosa]|uniref:Secreted protein n=1 Tax=Periconia macrospinosa TaxID=97972 RepID=A0A2V1D912_9PLEO|nr:hypothetical protein DM02DRAFT_633553 [Periconia macrospinosa]